MDKEALRAWLAEPRYELAEKSAQGVRKHVASLKSRGIDFYGYALHPGEPYDIGDIVGITNRETDIPVPRTNSQYPYYRLRADEWQICDHDRMAWTLATTARPQTRSGILPRLISQGRRKPPTRHLTQTLSLKGTKRMNDKPGAPATGPPNPLLPLRACREKNLCFLREGRGEKRTGRQVRPCQPVTIGSMLPMVYGTDVALSGNLGGALTE